MTEATTNVPVIEEKAAEGAAEERRQVESMTVPPGWWTFESLRRDIERAFEDFYRRPWRLPFTRTAFEAAPIWPGEAIWGKSPAVDIVETDREYIITSEMPGVTADNVEVKLSDGDLTLKCEKTEPKEEERGRVHVTERRYGALQRTFRIPESVDSGKIEASFSNGILAVTLPKKIETQHIERKIDVKAA